VNITTYLEHYNIFVSARLRSVIKYVISSHEIYLHITCNMAPLQTEG
jgi:hypothetical protein